MVFPSAYYNGYRTPVTKICTPAPVQLNHCMQRLCAQSHFFEYFADALTCKSFIAKTYTSNGRGVGEFSIRAVHRADANPKGETCMRYAALLVAISITATSALAQTMSSATQPVSAPSPYVGTPGDYVAYDFHFGTGETLTELKLHYLTLGTPHHDAAGHVDNAVLLLHGTGGNAHTLFVPPFSSVLFGPGQPLDIAHYFLIFPDDIGQGESSKPSDGLHMRFPRYDYDDMVRSQQQMLLDGLHIDHLRLILGTSMGCMQSFVWGETYPDFADALMPLACLPVPIAGRNRMMRYMIIENIKNDPAWIGGDYTSQPVQGLRAANELLFVMGSAPLVQAEGSAYARCSREVHRQLPLTRDVGKRCKQHDLLRRCLAELRPQREPQ